MLRNTTRSWGLVARLLHWLVAALVLAQIALGFAADEWPLTPTKLDLFLWHKSSGMLVLALTIVRIAWRLANPVPELPARMGALEQRAARAGHFMLYVLLVLLPLSGWFLNSASGIPFRAFRLIPVPAIVSPDRALQHTAESVHLALVVALAALLVVHVAAALRHHFVSRDDVLLRMVRGPGADR